MRPQLALRLLAFAGVALVAVVIALATRSEDDAGGRRSALPEAAPAPGGGWYKALAAPRPLPRRERRTACGAMLERETLGVAHPVLPCNVKIYIEYGDERVLTQVIDRGPYAQGREFDLTKALADRIDLHGTQPIRWRFAIAAED